MIPYNLSMKILPVFIALLIFSAVPHAAPDKCDLGRENAPPLLDLRLGMTAAEAGAVLRRGLKIKPAGQQTFFKNFINRRAKRKLAGLRALYLRFYEGRLYQIELFYEEDFRRWPDLAAFIADYSARRDFPPDFWQVEYGYARAACRGFSLSADYVLNPHIQLTDTAVAELVETRREEESTRDK